LNAEAVAAGVGALGLAALLGVSDAPNSTAALVSARTGTYQAVAGWSIAWHALGGLLAGEAVARTIVDMIHVSPSLAEPSLAAATFTSVGFTWLTTRRGLPTSASVGLVGGLAGAGVVAGGWRAVDWGGLSGLRLAGVFGVLGGILLAPLLGALVAALLDRVARRGARRLSRAARQPLGIGLWLSSAAVAVADGTNDGQKAMGILAIAASGSGALGPDGPGISFPEKLACATVLALFTVLGGRRVVRTVSRGLARGGSVDDLAAQGASAGLIFLGAFAGLPLSTSTVVTSAMIGTGVATRRKHVKWAGVVRILVVWAITVPACALVSGLLLLAWRASSGR